MDSMISCACGHAIGMHSADGCARKDCVCEIPDREVLQRAIDEVRTPYIAGEQRWASAETAAPNF